MVSKADIKFPAIARVGWSIVACCLLSSYVCQADTPTPEELCRQRNAASCEINGLKFFIEDDCPRGAKVLRPKGKERCDNIPDNIRQGDKAQSDAMPEQSAHTSDAVPAMPPQATEGGIFENAFFVVAVIGLLQGLISRVSWGPFIIVAVAMPVIVTWTMVSAAPPSTMGAEYLGAIGFEFLKLLVCSLLGWGAGLAVHKGLLKLMYR